MPDPAYKPTNENVAELLRARTYVDGQQLHAFTTDTRPTASEVGGLIDTAMALVVPRIGSTVPDGLVASATHLVALLAAALIERSYWPEQAAEEGSLAQGYEDLFEQGMTAFDGALGEQGDDHRAASIPMGNSVLSAWACRDLGRGLAGAADDTADLSI